MPNLDYENMGVALRRIIARASKPNNHVPATGSVTSLQNGGGITGMPRMMSGESITHTDGSQMFLLGLMGLTDDVYVA